MIAGYVATPDIYSARDYLHQSKVVTIVANAGGKLLSRSRKSYIMELAKDPKFGHALKVVQSVPEVADPGK